MTIQRIDPDERWSEAVIHNQVIYYTSVPSCLEPDTTLQMESALAAIDVILARAGSDKTRILDATIFLASKSDFIAMNSAWDNWVVAGQAPVRCTVEAGLMDPKYKVEIKIIAALR